MMSDWEEALRKYMSWGGMCGAVVFAVMFFFGVVEYFYNGLWDQISASHFASLVALPGAAFTSFFVVLVLRTVAGPIEFSVFKFEFKGASGPIVMWVLCFLAITLALRATWSLQYSAPTGLVNSLAHAAASRPNSQILTTAGLLCTFIGASSLFLSSQLKGTEWAGRYGGAGDPATTTPATAQANRYALRAKVGFALIGVGAMMQGIAVWTG